MHFTNEAQNLLDEKVRIEGNVAEEKVYIKELVEELLHADLYPDEVEDKRDTVGTLKASIKLKCTRLEEIEEALEEEII